MKRFLLGMGLLWALAACGKWAWFVWNNRYVGVEYFGIDLVISACMVFIGAGALIGGARAWMLDLLDSRYRSSVVVLACTETLAGVAVVLWGFGILFGWGTDVDLSLSPLARGLIAVACIFASVIFERDLWRYRSATVYNFDGGTDEMMIMLEDLPFMVALFPAVFGVILLML